MPERARWWNDAAKEYVATRRVEGLWGKVTGETVTRTLRSWPARFEAAGLPVPLHARDVTAETILAWKERPMGYGRHLPRQARPLKQPTAFQALWTLRGFLAWAGNPAAKKDALWRGKRGDATHRRWATAAILESMISAASPRAKIVISLAGWAGLRRREIASLRVGDLTLDAARPTMVVTRKGGRRQELPLGKTVAGILRSATLGRPPTDPVYPGSYRTIAWDLDETSKRVGRTLSCHDLRRTFGRILYYDFGVDLNTIRNLYNHATTEMTLYYIGATSDRMAEAVEGFDAPRQRVAEPIPMGV